MRFIHFSDALPPRSLRPVRYVAAVALVATACGGRVDGGTGDDRDTTGGDQDGGPIEGDGAGGQGTVEHGGGGVTNTGGRHTSSGGVISTGGRKGYCGDGRLDMGEDCDGAEFARGNSCEAELGYAWYGALRCTGYCQVDTSECCTDGANGSCFGAGGYTGAGGYAGAGGADPYTCYARQGYGAASGAPPPGGVPAPAPVPVPPPPPEFVACGSFAGGPYLGACIPVGFVPPSFGSMPWPADSCVAGYELCVPPRKYYDPASCFVPCESPLGGAGACVPTYIVEAPGSPGFGLSTTLGQVTCAWGETCVPCLSPIDQSVTGACEN